jgi:glycosidase
MRRISRRLQERFSDPGGSPFWLVGETFTGQDGHGLIMDYVAPYELDGQFDFPMMWAIRGTWVNNNGFDFLARRVDIGLESYGDAHWWMSPFLGNHDIPRMATEISTGYVDPWAETADPMEGPLSDTNWNVVNRMSQSFAFLLTQPGIPLVYYGDEIGLHGGGDPDNRRMMQFGDELSESQQTLLDRIRDIGRARAGHAALRRGEYRELWNDRNAYVYARDNGSGDAVIIAMYRNNSGDEPSRSWAVTIPTDLGLSGVTLTDVLNTFDPRSFEVIGTSAAITLTDWEYAIFVAEPD